MKARIITSLAVGASLAAAGAVFAQKPKPKFPEARARALALAKVPGGKITAEEVEQEKGLLIYSFELKVPGQPGIEEVNINANTGKLVGIEHEGPSKEKAESGERHEGHEAPESGETG